jgi:hypothetical protein
VHTAREKNLSRRARAAHAKKIHQPSSDIFPKSYGENQIWSKCSRARGSDAQISGAIQLPYESVFVTTFRKNFRYNFSKKTRLAILYNLREKSGPKINYWQSYSNKHHLNTPFERPSPVLRRRLVLVGLKIKFSIYCGLDRES